MRFVMIACALYTAACATGGARGDRSRPSSFRDVSVTISNLTTRPARIFLREGSADLGVGIVRGLESKRFGFPDGFGAGASEFQLEARVAGGADPIRSDRFTLLSRNVVSWTLSPAGSTPVTVR